MFLVAMACLLYVSCSKESRCSDYSLVSDGIETLCIIDQYDEALFLFDEYIKEYPKVYDYIDRRVALNLFSHTNREQEYFHFLGKYVGEGGIAKNIQFETESEFYNEHLVSIEKCLLQCSKSVMPTKDSLIISSFYYNDQRIRKDKIMERSEKRTQDSINQLALKGLIAKRLYTNIQLKRGLSLLLRHASQQYLTDFKTSGQLDYYVAQGVLTRDRYYDAVSYKKNEIYFDYHKYVKKETHNELNHKRREVGLLPIRLSPLVVGKNEIRHHLPNEENLRYTYRPNDISLYIEEVCIN